MDVYVAYMTREEFEKNKAYASWFVVNSKGEEEVWLPGCFLTRQEISFLYKDWWKEQYDN